MFTRCWHSWKQGSGLSHSCRLVHLGNIVDWWVESSSVLASQTLHCQSQIPDDYYRPSFKILLKKSVCVPAALWGFWPQTQLDVRLHQTKSNVTFSVLWHESENKLLSFGAMENLDFRWCGSSCDCMPGHLNNMLYWQAGSAAHWVKSSLQLKYITADARMNIALFQMKTWPE